MESENWGGVKLSKWAISGKNCGNHGVKFWYKWTF